MEDLFSNIDFDPIATPIGLVVIFLGIRLFLGAVKTAIKILIAVMILVGLYLFFYGGNVA